MWYRFLGSVWLCAAWVLGTVAAQPADAPPEKLTVAVSILPQAHFVERVGGERVRVIVLVGPGQSPHAYEPTPKQVAELAGARAYFTIGVEFERGILPRLRSSFPKLRIVDTRAGVPLRTMTGAETSAECDHGHDHGHHDHQGTPDPHIWLSPRLVRIQAQTIADALADLDPPGAETYRRNLAAFQADMDRLHDRLETALAGLKGREVFVFHPAFGYFLDEFGLRQIPVEIEGKEPTARQLATVIERAKAAGVRVIFVQPQFSRKSAEAVAEAIGGVVVPLDPLARDFTANLEDIAAKIQAKFAPPAAAAEGGTRPKDQTP